jgi:hypothetical protein
VTRAKWLAGLATLALAGTSSGVALATGPNGAAPKAHPTVGFTSVNVTLLPHVVKSPHRFAVQVHGHAAKLLTLDWWLVGHRPCLRTAREEANVPPNYLKHHFHRQVAGNFAEERHFSTTNRFPPPHADFSRGSLYHACAYLSEAGHTVASAAVSWRVE